MQQLQNDVVAKALRAHRVLLRTAIRRYPWFDRAELTAIYEDAVCEALRTHDPDRSSRDPWIKRVFRWHLGHALEKARRDPLHRSESLDPDPKLLNGTSPARAFLRQSAMAELLKLDPRRQTVAIIYLHGYTFAEVAEMVGVSRATAHHAYTEAIETVQEALNAKRT